MSISISQYEDQNSRRKLTKFHSSSTLFYFFIRDRLRLLAFYLVPHNDYCRSYCNLQTFMKLLQRIFYGAIVHLQL